MIPKISNLQCILKEISLLKQFRIFLRGHLALENLLFYESTLLYKRSGPTKRIQAGKFMIRQFVRSDSVDVINLCSQTRDSLENLKIFGENSFNTAENEIYELMESNFLLPFKDYLAGKGDPLIENFSPFLSPSYFHDLSYDDLEDLLESAEDGSLRFLVCKGCPHHGEELNGCEANRATLKLKKIAKKMKPMTIKQKLRRFSSMLSPFPRKRKTARAASKLESTASHFSARTVSEKPFEYTQVSRAVDLEYWLPAEISI